MLGCGAASETTTADIRSTQPVPENELQRVLDATLDEVYARRSLSLDRNAAWQILHGVLAYGQGFLVDLPSAADSATVDSATLDGATVGNATADSATVRIPAVEHLLNGGAMRGWDIRPGTPFDNGRQGLRVEMDVGSKAGQGHPDQWFAILAQCDLPATQTIKLGSREFTIGDMLSQIQYEAPRNETAEYSWTLIGLAAYVPTTSTWQAVDGKQWSVERLVQIELDHELHSSACGGTHRLIGLATALNRRQEEGEPVEGVWAATEERIVDAIDLAKSLQNPDGSFSTRYLARPSTSPDLAQNLGATGHVLEFLAVSMTDEELAEPWVENSVLYLCDLLDETSELPLECGALYHAVHGLVLYRQRRFGERTWPPTKLP